MPEYASLFILSVVVVLTVYIFQRFKPVKGFAALFAALIACAITGLLHIYIVGGATLGFLGAVFFIYAGSNLIFQIIKLLSKLGEW